MRKLVVSFGMAAMMVLSATAANASIGQQIATCMTGQGEHGQAVADMCTNPTPRP